MPTFTGPIDTGGAFASVKKNITDSSHFAGYADQADLANIPSYLRTTVGASAYTLDGKLYFLTNVSGAGTWTEFSTGGGFTAGTDLAGDSTNQTVIGITGTSNKTVIRDTSRTLEWAASTTTPKLYQADNTTNSATAATLLIQAANATGTTATGGAFDLRTGTGTTAAGTMTLRTGSTAQVTISPSAITMALPTTVNSATANSTAITVQTNSTTRWLIGHDAAGDYLGPAGTLPTDGLLRCPAGDGSTLTTSAVMFKRAGAATEVLGVGYSGGTGADALYYGELVSYGLTGTQARPVTTYVSAQSQVYVTVAGGTNGLSCQSTGVAMYANELGWATTASAPYILWPARTSDAAAVPASIRAGAAYGSASTHKDGGIINLEAGTPTDTAGRRRLLAVYDKLIAAGGTVRVFVGDVRTGAQTSFTVGLNVNGIPTSTNLPDGDGVVFIGNCTTAPSTSTVGGGALYVEAGALKFIGSSGTVTPIAPA